MSSDIPTARVRLLALAHRLDALQHGLQADEVRDIVSGLLTRQKPIRKAPVKSKKLSPYLADTIRNYAHMYPRASVQKIADFCGVNPGRVSEVLNGKR